MFNNENHDGAKEEREKEKEVVEMEIDERERELINKILNWEWFNRTNN